jgi:AraC-like DNA-binding protein
VETGGDLRTWVPTERVGESITVGAPVDGLELVSVRGSKRHWSEAHDTFTIAVIRRDHRVTGCDWRTRRQCLTTISGQMMQIEPGDSHRTLHVPVPAAFDVLKIAPAWIEQASAELGVRHGFHFAAPSCDNPRVFRAIHGLIDAVARGDTQFELESATHDVVASIVTELAESRPQHPVSKRGRARDPRLDRVRQYLFESLDERPRLEELESDSGLAKSQLCALFLDEFGATMGQCWTDRRIALAKDMLLCGVSATRVAADLGFSDQAHFSRVFRRLNGLPPAAWAVLYRANSCRRATAGSRPPARARSRSPSSPSTRPLPSS